LSSFSASTGLEADGTVLLELELKLELELATQLELEDQILLDVGEAEEEASLVDEEDELLLLELELALPLLELAFDDDEEVGDSLELVLMTTVEDVASSSSLASAATRVTLCPTMLGRAELLTGAETVALKA